MKKLLALSCAMLFLGVGIASATDVEITGSYFAQGNYNDNVQSVPGSNVADFQYYEHELSVDTTFKMDDTTSVFTRIEARDGNWLGDQNPNDVDEGLAGANLAALDDNIVLEQVYGTHTFGTGTNVKVGLMTGGSLVWGSDSFNNGFETYRIFVTQPTSIGSVIGIIEKNNEQGSNVVGDDNDTDTYYLGLVAEMNGITVDPIVAYQKVDNQTAANRLDIYVADLYLAGQMGNFGWETDAIYVGLNFDGAAGINDVDLYGLYGHVWVDVNALTLGVQAMYASFDDEAGVGLNSGDDFSAGGALIMGDDVHFNANEAVTGAGSADLVAPTLLALTADYQVNAKTTIGGYLGYAKCNNDVAGSMWNGATIWEIDADVTYAITSNLEYQVAAGTAQMEFGDATADPDRSVEVYHKLTFNF
jgi:hypothetical protein